MAETGPPGEGVDSPEARAYRRGFKQKSRRDDYAIDLFEEIRAKLAGDLARVEEGLRELARLYNPLVDGPIVDLPTRARIMALLREGRAGEAEALLDARYRLYAPLDDAERHGPTGPGA
ncbi:MAG TPA: hypothetical protein VFV05_21780 [Methylomirabilota bacterium]|nr:hypothetical protein [Methylomirabilota bacterium]